MYFVLDDNRLYRRTDAPPPPDVAPRTPKKSKAKARKSNGRNTRSAKKPRIGRRVIETSPEETEAEEPEEVNGAAEEEAAMDDFHMQRWELLAVSMDEYNEFIDSIKKSKDVNEKALVKQIQNHVMPILLEAEEERKRKEVRRMKELEMLQKMATSKRSSRLADKQDRIREEREAAEAEAARKAELDMAHKEQRRQQQMEEQRESRRETREQRLREREVKRILEQERLEKEQEMLSKMETEGVLVDAERGRISERQLKADMEKRKRDLETLQPDDSWYFDCVCGIHGQNLDDGSHSIACEKCSTWQHSKCNGISEQQAERDDFHFVCRDCKKKEENPLPKIKLKMGSSPQPSKAKPAPKPRVASGVVISKASPKAPKAPKTNGAGPGMVYPGPPPAAPGQNGAPHSNGAAPTNYQWHAYQPPQPTYQQSYPPYSPYQNQYPQQAPRPAAGPSSPVSGTFNHQTPASYAQSYSPPRQPSAPYTSGHPPAMQSRDMSPRTAQAQYQPQGYQAQRPPSAPYQQSHSPSAPPRQAQPPPNTLPPIQQPLQQPGSPAKRPVSSGFGPVIPPPLMKSPHTNGTQTYAPPPAQARPTSSHAHQAHPPTGAQVTPAPQARAPVFTPNSSFSAAQGQTPFNAAPGYSPTKQPSPKVAASSPRVPSGNAVASPAQAQFEPPRQPGAAGVSPVKHDPPSSPPPPAHALSVTANLPVPSPAPAPLTQPKADTAVMMSAASASPPAATAPAKDLVNPIQNAPSLQASAQAPPPMPTPPQLPAIPGQNGDGASQ